MLYICSFCAADYSLEPDGRNCKSDPGSDQCGGGCKNCVWENYKVCKECKPDYKMNDWGNCELICVDNCEYCGYDYSVTRN